MATIASGYAEALLKACFQKNNVRKVKKELSDIVRLLSGHMSYFSNPQVSTQAHCKLLCELFGQQTDDLTLQFILLLAGKRQLKRLPEIYRRFDQISAKALGDITVTIRSPYPLEDQLIEKLKEYLATRGLYTSEEKTHAQFEVILDKSLVGGFVAQCRGNVLDESLKTRLLNLKLIAEQWR